jgi:hypothetical protein
MLKKGNQGLIRELKSVHYATVKKYQCRVLTVALTTICASDISK